MTRKLQMNNTYFHFWISGSQFKDIIANICSPLYLYLLIASTRCFFHCYLCKTRAGSMCKSMSPYENKIFAIELFPKLIIWSFLLFTRKLQVSFLQSFSISKRYYSNDFYHYYAGVMEPAKLSNSPRHIGFAVFFLVYLYFFALNGLFHINQN
jgi:hypothetical protein